MKQIILPTLKMTLFCIILFCVFYPLLILVLAKMAPGKGEGETLSSQGRVVGYALVGQQFSKDNYFWGRPSAVNYNANGSGGSNKSPGNPDYLSDIKSRIDHFLSSNPGVRRQDIPADLVTASASGLDPDISVESANIQVDRIAKARKVTRDRLLALINEQTESPLLGVLGPEKVNVLKLNIALDNIAHR